MASFSDPWKGTPDQVALVSSVTGDSFAANKYLAGPYVDEPISNNYWINSHGQSAALFWADVKSMGQTVAVQMWNHDKSVNVWGASGNTNAPNPVYQMAVVNSPKEVISAPAVGVSNSGTFQSAESNANSALNVNSPMVNLPQIVNSLPNFGPDNTIIWVGIAAVVLILLVKK